MLLDDRYIRTAVIIGSSLVSVPYGYSSAHFIADITGLPSEINPHTKYVIPESGKKRLVH